MYTYNVKRGYKPAKEKVIKDVTEDIKDLEKNSNSLKFSRN
jgi:hypothetical protein